MSRIIYNHNEKFLTRLKWKNKETNKSSCHCRINEECPMEVNCNLENVVYQVNIFPKESKFNN